ncbi:hypothetical protein [Paenibacillus sacheonensis]|uniref:Uncharacterized protein n=1 Tax=Paenibacillus sacheonensis TaxID=742054 RepID=A0A7X4YTN1_9BACL|nr:hypothetical protein [Paenibacillus sacheonensis]MBM7565647.1 hypothetical protein [Paenibacillus sacheonensis]NBC72295.1 hypothetical protein [Paenibacillus sacheonensis]
MQELLKLLFSNFYVVIIIVGFLLTMLNKSRGKQNPGGNRMPPFGGGAGGRPTAAQPQPERPQQPERPRPVLAQAERRPAEQRRQTSEQGRPTGGMLNTLKAQPSGEGISMEHPEDLGPALYDWSIDEKKAPVSPPKPAGSAMPAASKRQAPQGASFHMPKGKELRQAFILSEILGPPRSKKPLQRK